MKMHGLLGRTARVSFVLTVLATIILLVGSASAAQAQAVSYSAEEITFVQLINDYRVSLGLNPLMTSDLLSESGDRHSSDMAKYGFFDHYTERSDWFAPGAAPWDRMAASGYNFNTYKGENIAAGQTTAAKVFEAWKNSPSHNENMVNPNYKVMGISLLYVSGSTYKYYWTTDFGGYIDPTAGSLSNSDSSDGGSSGAGSGFVDVNRNTLYANEIELLASRGIVNGYGSGAFGPYDKVTRQQFAKMIVVALGRTVLPVTACSFVDVSGTPSPTDSAYPAGYVATCAAEGITLGKTPYAFKPYDNITRAQLITMVARAAEIPAPPAGYRPCFGNFSDLHYPWAARAAYAGWLDDFRGMGQDFDFWAPATRGEVCLLLAALLGN
jgi:uncharacterized protein YkwD